jgi:hypothetical protein
LVAWDMSGDGRAGRRSRCSRADALGTGKPRRADVRRLAPAVCCHGRRAGLARASSTSISAAVRIRRPIAVYCHGYTGPDSPVMQITIEYCTI